MAAPWNPCVIWEAISVTSKPYTVIVATRVDDGVAQFMMVRHRERGWELPGGKVEDHEGPVHCALREFREETGHLLSDPKFVMKMEKDNGTCYVFCGGLGPAAKGKDEDEAIEERGWFTALPEPLAFPDDPYEEIGEAMGISFR